MPTRLSLLVDVSGMRFSVLDLAEADALGNLPLENEVPRLRRMIEKAMKVPVQDKPPLDGNEIQRVLGVGPGPQVGEAVRFLIDEADEYAARGLELSKAEAERLLEERFK